eukprot:1160836-Pelagomonas_calceolata.AAC.3
MQHVPTCTTSNRSNPAHFFDWASAACATCPTLHSALRHSLLNQASTACANMPCLPQEHPRHILFNQALIVAVKVRVFQACMVWNGHAPAGARLCVYMKGRSAHV